MRRETRTLLLGALLASLLPSCAGASCPRESFTSAPPLLRSFVSMRSPARAMRAEARVDRRDETGRIRGTVLMLLERPDHVRFDAMTQFGPAAVLTSDGHEFALVDLRENRFFVGPSCADNIERLLGLPLDGADVARFLFGETPLLDAPDESVVCDGGHYVVTRRAADGRSQILTLDVRQADVDSPTTEQRLRLRSSEVRGADGALEWRVRYDDHRVIEDPNDTVTPHRGVAMPFTIHFELPAHGIDTLVRFSSIELNPSIPADAFHQEPRDGLSIEPVECGL
jgi:outer membrane lipoprotein-sorting protein